MLSVAIITFTPKPILFIKKSKLTFMSATGT